MREPWPSLEAPREPYKHAEGVSNKKILENPGRRLKDSIERTLENLAPSEGRSSERILQNPGRRLKDDRVRDPTEPWPPAEGRSGERSYRTLAAG
jgi:hypothetical protein